MGVAVSHRITWFQTQPILTSCQVRYHGHCGTIVALTLDPEGLSRVL